ncbi:phage holin family protein [Brevibacterium litoralis]|uniref:phage holin family protein n=1 Tax=Brevibacterium litoralis TaxID=3138935 RepID=UPI0032EC4EE1
MFLLRIACTALGFWAAVWLLPGMDLTVSSGFHGAVGHTAANVLGYGLIGLLFGLVNGIVRPVVNLVSLPISCLTLGLFALVVNVLMMLLTAWLSGYTPVHLEFTTFWWAAIATLVVWLVSSVLAAFLPDGDKNPRPAPRRD